MRSIEAAVTADEKDCKGWMMRGFSVDLVPAITNQPGQFLSSTIR
ncbi:MAG: hypothetical protein AB8B79_03120 [Granulosicoccus sp.]